MAVIFDEDEGIDRTFSSRGARKGVFYVTGLSQDSVFLECKPSGGRNFETIIGPISENSFTTLDPFPEGEYRVTKDGTQDSVQAIITL